VFEHHLSQSVQWVFSYGGITAIHVVQDPVIICWLDMCGAVSIFKVCGINLVCIWLYYLHSKLVRYSVCTINSIARDVTFRPI